MNLRQTAEVAAIVATSAGHIVENPRPVPTESLHGYWKQSRTRLKCWFAGLQAAQHNRDFDDIRSLPQQQQIVALCREILVTEMLTRVWSTVLTAADLRQRSNHCRAAVEAVYRGHLEARHEVLRFIASDGKLPAREQLSLDRFRRRIERWTDALIGPLLAAYGVGEFAFNNARARDFSENALQESLQGSAAAHAPFLLAGVAAAFPKTSDADRERAMLNLAVVRAILAAYPGNAFASDGRLKSAARGKLERSSRHAEAAPPTSDDGNSASQRKPGLSFIAMRRKERDSEGPAD